MFFLFYYEFFAFFYRSTSAVRRFAFNAYPAIYISLEIRVFLLLFLSFLLFLVLHVFPITISDGTTDSRHAKWIPFCLSLFSVVRRPRILLQVTRNRLRRNALSHFLCRIPPLLYMVARILINKLGVICLNNTTVLPCGVERPRTVWMIQFKQ